MKTFKELKTVNEKNQVNNSKISMKSITPIFRIFDEELAKEFYVEFLGFNLDWEHRFEEDLPLYMQISFDSCIIHLSGHFGDGSPGAVISVEVENIKQLHTNLTDKKYKYARPGLNEGPGGTKEIQLNDPFGNKIIFYEQIVD